MSKSEPVLIPQWLKNSGGNNGGGTNRSGFFLRSDDQSGSKRGRNRPSVRSSEPDIIRSSTHQINSPYLRRTSSSKDSSNLKSYGSFSRSNRNRESEDINGIWDRDKRRNNEYSDRLGSLQPCKHNKNVLGHSQSVVSKVGDDLCSANSSNHSITNEQLISASSVPNSSQATFGQDFPSLLAEQRQGSDLSRASSPGFTGTVPSHSSVSSSTVSQDDLENQEVGIGRTDSLSSQVAVTANSALLAQRVNGLNMAEAVVQGPSHAQTPPQLSVDTQRLQELAIKQSRQLIPMTPSMPRPLSPVEKPKPKMLMQQQSQLQPNHHSNQTIRGGGVGIDVGKASTMGKLQVLKSSRVLNGVSSTAKDISSLQNGVISPLTQTAGATYAAPNKNIFSNQNPAPNERKSSVASTTTLEKKTSLQAKSRSEFFNLIKRKSSSSSQSSVETSNNYSVGDAPAVEDVPKINPNGESCSGGSDFVRHGDFFVPPPDEEEAAFLRSLGWKEGSGEDESLTEEEINAFYESIKAKGQFRSDL